MFVAFKMKKILFFVTALMISCFSKSADLERSARKKTVQISFISPKKFNLWILGVSSGEIHIADASNILHTPNTQEIIFIKAPSIIKFKKIKVVSDEKDIKINGNSIDGGINAVVDEDGKILMHAFIRNFDK